MSAEAKFIPRPPALVDNRKQKSWKTDQKVDSPHKRVHLDGGFDIVSGRPQHTTFSVCKLGHEVTVNPVTLTVPSIQTTLCENVDRFLKAERSHSVQPYLES